MSSKVISLIKDMAFPISTNQFQSLTNKSHATLLHYTNIKGLLKLINIQNTKKPVCCTNVISLKHLNTGIGTSGGIVCAIKGIPIFYFDGDAYTLIDLHGRRWFLFLNISQNLSDVSLLSPLYNIEDLWIDKLQNFAKKYDTNNKQLYTLILFDIMNNTNNKLKLLFITKFFKLVQIPFFLKHKNLLADIFRYSSRKLKLYALQLECDKKLNLALLIKCKVLSIGINLQNLTIYDIIKQKYSNIKLYRVHSHSLLSSFGKNHINLGYNAINVLTYIASMTYFPILPKQMLNLLNSSKMKALHYTSLTYLKNLANIQNTNKPICCTKLMDYTTLERGIGTGGGACTIVLGYPVFYFDNDAYSSRDAIDRRWIDFRRLAKNTKNKRIVHLYNILHNLYYNTIKQFNNDFNKIYKVTLEHNILSSFKELLMLKPDLLSLYILQYFLKVQRNFYLKNKLNLKKCFSYYAGNNYKSFQSQKKLDLLLLLKINIQSVGVSLNALYDEFSIKLFESLNLKNKSTIKNLKLFIVFVKKNVSLAIYTIDGKPINLNLIFNGNAINKKLISLGGAGGHMTHVFEDNSLTIGDLKTIINRTLYGKLDVLSAIHIKTDGQNLNVSYKDGNLVGARNQGHMKNFGKTALTKLLMKAKFEGRGDIQDAFYFAMVDLLKAIKSIGLSNINTMFLDGKHWLNILIIYDKTRNIIPYDLNMLVFHDLVTVDVNGLKIGLNIKQAGKLKLLISKVNQDIQKKYNIKGPDAKVTTLPKSVDFKNRRLYYMSQINILKNKYKNISDKSTLGDYVYLCIQLYIIKNLIMFKVDIDKKTIDALTKRWAFDDKSTKITDINKSINNKVISDWVSSTDKTISKSLYKLAIWPWLKIYLLLAVLVMQNITSALVVNKLSAIQKLRQLLLKSILQIRNTKNILLIGKLLIQLNRLNSIGGFDSLSSLLGIIFTYNGKQYKLTGSFAPLNNIIGMIKYVK